MNRKEYNECVDLYSDSVYRFILKNIKDTEKANDIVQDSFLKLWDKRKNIDYERVKSYLFTTAYHTMIDSIRKDKNKTQLEDSHLNRGHEVSGNEYTGLKEILDMGLNQLPDIQKNLILLRDYEGYSYKEIGEITDLSESQVKVYIFRARKAMRDYIVKMDLVI
ncbi:MAG: RNA polymerase sigma factor [Hyphomicrobiales bacterium]